MAEIVGSLIGIAIATVISGTLIWIVSKLNMGLKVSGFGSALIAGLLIGVLSVLVSMIVPEAGGVVGALIHLVVAALVLMFAGKLLKGLTVDGFQGAVIAALAMAAITWLLNVLLLASGAVG